MNYLIVYWSRFGNGKKIVEYLGTILEEKGHTMQVLTTDETDPTNMPDADVYVFSASAEAFRVQANMRRFLKNLQGMEDSKYGIINTHSMQKNWLYSMEKLLSKKKMEKIAEVDFIIGKEGQETGNGHLEGWEEKVKEFAEELEIPMK